MKRAPAPLHTADGARAAPYAAKLRTPFAVLGIRTANGKLTGVDYLPRSERAQRPVDAFTAEVVAEIERYLVDPQHRFALPLDPAGTPFQRRVWQEIDRIPVGESRTYGEIARALRTGPRAVGNACGANPIALVTPCHRVVGSRGALGGFGGAAAGDPLLIKRWLLVHEGYRFGA
ncbi:MAG: methylated-DNA--[protein]-cysteine S-methyltransferase [Betaproteobacteria bacterium]|nr:methylated-DNA--[protein]-cysteine S-methyltransferase [Betaproteobacteria bacterium]